MSRPVFFVKVGECRNRLFLDSGFLDEDHPSPFVDPKGGSVRFRMSAVGGWTEPFEVKVRDLYMVNDLAVRSLKDRGYDLDGVRANFWALEFYEHPNPQAEICNLLGDEYRFDREEPLLGTIRRVRPPEGEQRKRTTWSRGD